MSPNQTILSQHFAKWSTSLICMVLFSVALFSLPNNAYAVCAETPPNSGIWMEGSAPCCSPGKICNPTKYATIDAFLLAVVGVVVQYGLILIVLFLVLAGFKFVAAQGNPEKINDAKKMLVWVVVGAFVLIGVFVIRAAICGTIDAIQPAGSPPTCQ